MKRVPSNLSISNLIHTNEDQAQQELAYYYICAICLKVVNDPK